MEGEYTLKRPVTLTCPECGGSVAEERADALPYFICHIGHRFGADSMEEAQFQKLEQAFEVALRTLNGRAALCRRLAEAARARDQTLTADRWESAGREAEQRAELLMSVLHDGWVRPPAGDEQDGEAPAG